MPFYVGDAMLQFDSDFLLLLCLTRQRRSGG